MKIFGIKKGKGTKKFIGIIMNNENEQYQQKEKRQNDINWLYGQRNSCFSLLFDI